MKNLGYIKKLAFIIISISVIWGNTLIWGQISTVADTEIVNYAEGSYQGDNGENFNTVSPPVKFKVRAISALVVTPDETSPSETIAANEQITRKFTICNLSNSPDTYTITNLAASSPAQIIAYYFDVDNDGQITGNDIPISLNNTQSPVVQPGACINVLVDLNTNNIALNQLLTINLTARSNLPNSANGFAEDVGTIINTTGKNAIFTDPNDPTLIPQKLIENQARFVANKDQAINYQISFRNNGDVPAKNVVVTDEMPAELTYITNTLRVNGAQVSDTVDADEGSVVGNLLTVKLANPLLPGQMVIINFQALIKNSQTPAQGIVNIAKVSGSNAPAVETSQAVAVVDPFGVVYAARGGAGSPIPNARVVISTTPNVETPLQIPANQGFAPNFENANPYLTDPKGRFSFGLRPDQLGTPTQPAVYYMMVTAPGFRDRLIQISLTPTGNGLFRMTVRAMDGLPLAVAGGFELTVEDVDIRSIADVAMNIPMFESSTLELTKSVDRIQGEIGDILTYRLDLHNASVAPLIDVVVNDNLPESFNYVENSAVIERNGAGQPIEPLHNGRILHFRVGDLPSGARATISYRVRVGVNARPGEGLNTAISSGVFPSGEVAQTGVVKAAVRINGGIFSMKQILIGRVFIDDDGDNMFDEGERPVVGARVYLANGEAAVTDSQGMYNIPAISEGAQVIGIDPITLPQGFVLSDNNSRAGKSWTRLLRTPLGGGGLLRQNFPLQASLLESPAADGGAETNQPESKQAAFNPKNILDEVRTENVNFKKPAENAVRSEEYHSVVPGDLEIHSYRDNSVVMTAAANIEISVAQNWKVQLELNDLAISDKNIGTTREDRKNQITTYTYIGLGLKPGPNKLRATATDGNGVTGKSTNITLFGRGLAKNLEVIADSKMLQASGRDTTRLFVRAFDAWGNPAQDNQVMITASAGSFIKEEEYAKNQSSAKANKVTISQTAKFTNGINSEQSNKIAQQQTVEMKDGVGVIKFLSGNQTGKAIIKASTGLIEAETDIQFIPEIRPGMLVSVAEVTVGKNAPEMQNRGVEENVRSHVQFFYRGSLISEKNMLTLAYDSQQPLNRVSGQDRLFQLDPLDRVYPIFGDSSTRFQETQSNSKIYARLDRGRNYAMFGDFQADMEQSRLVNYQRKLTGAKIHLENSKGDFVSVTGARPNTSFARQIIPGGTLGVIQLSYPDVMPGSEVLAIETRDRRSPDIILTREILSRGIDYNLDTTTGTIFLLRSIPTFDRNLNLIQVIATYEYRGVGLESGVYTARGSKGFDNLGLRVGASYVDQRQADDKPFRLGGIDLSLNLPNKGKLEAEVAVSKGNINNGFSFFNNPNATNKDGNAFFVRLNQPIDAGQTNILFEGSRTSENFSNPFGATVTSGNTRGTLTVDTKPVKNGNLKVNVAAEKNETANVDNSRITAGAHWTQTVNEKVNFTVGFDHRNFRDNKNDKTVNSNLLTFGANFKPTDKLDFSVKREQNLGEADPSYPNQTTFQANYRINNWAKVFFTQRLAAGAITPIADVSGTGFAFSKARNETAIGVETNFGKYTSMSGRYQLENGINGTDSFAVVGLQNRLPINKQISLDFGFERAFHLAGEGKSYNNFMVGANYLPNDSFRSSFRYELRNREGLGQVFSAAAAGEIKKGWTAMARYQYGNVDFNDRKNKVSDGQVAMAIRPHNTDRYGLLFAYTHRDSFLSNGAGKTPTVLKSDVLSADGFHQTTKRLELYGRFALKFNGDGTINLPYASSLTYLAQGRAQYQLSRYFDVAGEARYIFQPSGNSRKQWYGVEAGYWALPDLRIGAGYNFSRSQEPFGFNNNNLFNKNGFYFVVSSKVARMFNLFGTKKEGLKSEDEEQYRKAPVKTPIK